MKKNVAFTLISFAVLKWNECLSVQLPFELPFQILVQLLLELEPNLLVENVIELEFELSIMYTDETIPQVGLTIYFKNIMWTWFLVHIASCFLYKKVQTKNKNRTAIDTNYLDDKLTSFLKEKPYFQYNIRFVLMSLQKKFQPIL